MAEAFLLKHPPAVVFPHAISFGVVPQARLESLFVAETRASVH